MSQTPEQKRQYYLRHADERREYARRYRKENPRKCRESQNKWYAKQLEELAGRPKPQTCEICGRGGRIHFDHSHNTGQFRGWLCGRCNMALGLCADSPDILRALAGYIEHCPHLL